MKQTNFFSKLTAVYLALMAGGLLLYPGLGGYSVITAQKSLAYLYLSGGFAAVCVIGRLELALVGVPLARPRFRSTQIMVLLLWLFTGLSAVFSPYPDQVWLGGNHWEGLLTLSLYYLTFLLVSQYADPKPWLLTAFAAAMGLNCLLAFVQLAGHNPLTLYPAGTNYHDHGKLFLGRLMGTVGSITLQAAMMSLTVPMLVTAILKGKAKTRVFFLIPLGFCLILLPILNIDAGLVGVTGGILLTLPLLPKNKKTRQILAVLLVVLLAVFLLILYLFGEHFSGFLAEAGQVLHGRWEDSFGSNRGYIWRKTLELVPERWLLGGGPDTLGLRLQKYRELYSKRFDVTVRLTLDMAHNEYLNILANQGLPALLLYLGVLLTTLRGWIRHAHDDVIVAVCGSGVVGYCVQACFGISTPFTTSYLWLTLAVLTARLSRKEASP